MPEYSLDELTKLAGPALRYAELIEIARRENPNNAQRVASGRWPIRQAKATRFLAMLRRDYGQEAFSGLVSSLEHARPSGTEHAQGDVCMPTFDSSYPRNVRNVVFVHNLYEGKDPDTLAIRHVSGDNYTDVSLNTEFTRFGLDQAGRRSLVRRVLQSMLDNWTTPEAPQYYAGTLWESALLAYLTFVGDDAELHQRLLLAAVVHSGGHQYTTARFVSSILPCWDQNATLQDVVNHLLNSGCTEDEIRAVWGQMLEIRDRTNRHTINIVSYWEGITLNGRNFHDEAAPVARKRWLYELADILVNGHLDDPDHAHCYAPDYYKLISKLATVVGYQWCREDAQLKVLEGYFVTCLARGAAATAADLLWALGSHFNLWSQHQEGSYEAALERLMRCAIDQAEEVGHFGTATALAEYLGDWETADRLRERARALGQRVRLTFRMFAGKA